MPRGRRKKPFKFKLKEKTVYTFFTVSFFLLAGLIILSFSRKGFILSKIFYSLFSYFGLGLIFLPFLLISAGLIFSRLRWAVAKPNVFVGTCIILFSLIGVTQSGRIGFEFWQNLAFFVTPVGAFICLFGLAFIGFVIAFNTSLEEIVLFFAKLILSIKKGMIKMKTVPKPALLARGGSAAQSQRQGPMKIVDKKTIIEKESEESVIPDINQIAKRSQAWQYPPISLLSDVMPAKADRGDIKGNAQVIERTLESFGIAARVAEVNLGPSVTQYALEIALGTKLSKITTLANDLALALAAPTGQIRIEAPIPGRSLVGVEVPNRSLEYVNLRQMLTSEAMKKVKSKLAVSLGLNVAGEPVVGDIAKMPHVLIAGSTGSGKSVCLQSFISTILFRASPSEVNFILVDPKRVELTQYNDIPHLLTPVIVDVKKVLPALKWAISLMDQRYKLFAEVGARNIEAYNELSGFAALPYLLIIIDELADIMMYSPAEVEDSICRIAQMARATGIHLVVSTQRPSVDVITGLIKANIPCRIAFNVSSQIDSRVIIDTPGAEKLLGRGDMLYVPPDQAKPTRIQGAFVSDKEVQNLIGYLKKSGITPSYSEEITNAQPETISSGDGLGDEGKDGLFDEAVQIVCQYNRASASLLQRRLKVGYARAARIIDQLETSGVIGPGEGAKPREVLIKGPEEILGGAAQPQDEPIQ